MLPEVEIKEHVGKQSMDTEKEDGWVEVQNLVLQPIHQSIFLSSTIHKGNKRSKLDQRFKDFLIIFKKLKINNPFSEALEQMHNSKFMKQICSKKMKLE